MKITLDTANMTAEQIIELFDRLGGEVLDFNDELQDFRNALVRAALETGRCDFNEATGDIVLTDLLA